VAALEEQALFVSLVRMKRNLFFALLGVAVLFFAVAGWTVQGVRWAVAAPVRAF
jgi:hypothetical protein